MARKCKKERSLVQIFDEGKKIGTENVLLSDGELGVLLSGDQESLSSGTVANWRNRGQLNLRYIKVGREARYKLSDAIMYRDKRFKN